MQFFVTATFLLEADDAEEADQLAFDALTDADYVGLKDITIVDIAAWKEVNR